MLVQGGETSFDDCVYHLVCPCCTLCQVCFRVRFCFPQYMQTEYSQSYPTSTKLVSCTEILHYDYCELEQESRTLEMNNVQDGMWHGRGDTICIGSFSEDSKPYLELSPPFVVSTKCPELLSMQKASSDRFLLPNSAVGHAPPLIPLPPPV